MAESLVSETGDLRVTAVGLLEADISARTTRSIPKVQGNAAAAIRIDIGPLSVAADEQRPGIGVDGKPDDFAIREVAVSAGYKGRSRRANLQTKQATDLADIRPDRHEPATRRRVGLRRAGACDESKRGANLADDDRAIGGTRAEGPGAAVGDRLLPSEPRLMPARRPFSSHRP